MTRVLFVDVVGGAAGDMLLAALIDAGASEERIRQAVESVIPGRFRFSTETVLPCPKTISVAPWRSSRW